MSTLVAILKNPAAVTKFVPCFGSLYAAVMAKPTATQDVFVQELRLPAKINAHAPIPMMEDQLLNLLLLLRSM
jgi:hypothetical protein